MPLMRLKSTIEAIKFGSKNCFLNAFKITVFFKAHFPISGRWAFFYFQIPNARFTPSAHVAMSQVDGVENRGSRRGLSSIG